MRFRRTQILRQIEPQLGPAIIFGERFVRFVNKDQRHQRGQRAASLKGQPRLERHADHDAENSERTEKTCALHCLECNPTHLFHAWPPSPSFRPNSTDTSGKSLTQAFTKALKCDWCAARRQHRCGKVKNSGNSRGNLGGPQQQLLKLRACQPPSVFTGRTLVRLQRPPRLAL